MYFYFWSFLRLSLTMLSPRCFLLWLRTIPLSALMRTLLAVEAMSTTMSTPDSPPPTMRTVFWTNSCWEGCRY